MAEKNEANLTGIEMLVLDVDGVMTDGTVTINSDASETKSFSALDGHGIRMWQRAGLKLAFLSGRTSKPTEVRAKQLDVEYVLQECHDKLDSLKKLLEQTGLSPDKVAYIGDDLPDLPAVRYVAFGVAVANAVDQLKQHADYVTTRPGGKGAVREVIEYILKSTGRWQQLVKSYLS